MGFDLKALDQLIEPIAALHGSGASNGMGLL
jgi:hypothetical protein